MAIEAIDEYLATAEHCVTTRKANGGLYGYPAILLLFTIIDTISNYLGYPEHSFRAIQNFDPNFPLDQVKNLKNWHRNLPAHQAIIMPGTKLSDEPTGAPIEFGRKGEPTHIRVIPFYQLVKHGWDAFDKTKIKPKLHPQQRPKAPLNLSGTPT